MSVNSPLIDNLGVYRRNPNADKVHSDAARGMVLCERMTFLESHATGAGTTTNYCVIPPGGIVHNIIVYAEAVHTGTSSSLDVGDGDDPDGYFASVDLKATDLTANQTIDFHEPGGKQGAYIDVANAGDGQADHAGSHINQRYYPDGGVIEATVTYGATPLDAGITHVFVEFSVPYATFGTFVAS